MPLLSLNGGTIYFRNLVWNGIKVSWSKPVWVDMNGYLRSWYVNKKSMRSTHYPDTPLAVMATSRKPIEFNLEDVIATTSANLISSVSRLLIYQRRAINRRPSIQRRSTHIESLGRLGPG